MVPEDKKSPVARGLQEAFGVAQPDDIRDVTKAPGSELTFRIIVKGSPYLLRIITRINEQTDPARQFACLKAASDAGLAPRVRYASAEDGISISDVVEPVLFPIADARIRIPAALRRLHALPPFPKTFNYVTAHNGFIWRFRSAGILPQNEMDEVFSNYERLCAVYPRLDDDMVSSHNNLKPDTILFDGWRVWLTDWIAAFVNDRYFDLAIVANFVANTDADEKTYLEKYFGQPPDEYQLARFFLMRQVLHIFSTTIYLLLSSAGRPVNQSEALPPFDDFHRRLWANEVDLADNAQKILYARLHWQQLLKNMRDARFADSLRIVSDRHANQNSVPKLLPTAP